MTREGQAVSIVFFLVQDAAVGIKQATEDWWRVQTLGKSAIHPGTIPLTSSQLHYRNTSKM